MQLNSTDAIPRIAKVACTALVVASAGFGSVYAYKVGSEASILLGLLTVFFAVALEVIKPLAIAASFNAFASFAVMRGLALGLLGGISVAYSLSAELSLISMSRGDLSAQRAATARQTTIQAERIEAARKELAGLAPARGVAELEALAEGTTCPPIRQVQVSNGRRDTVEIVNTHCSKLVKLKTELGRAKRKAELESLIAGAATTARDGPTAVENSDPGATNLATYLSALGMNVSSDTVSRWLALIPTLAIEIGSSLAAILVGSISAQPKNEPAQHQNELAQRKDDPAQQRNSPESSKEVPETHQSHGLRRLIQMSQVALSPATNAATQGSANVVPYVARPKAHTRQSAEEEIVRQLKLHGSSAVWGAQRQMAFTLGIDRSTFNRAASSLAKRGLISVTQDGNRVVMQLAS